ncbi:hypothetical protein [Aquimarina algiphila]|uniref:Uncharacterized protein n=1 Tax=Aquimarina algiphila TaxID=2047982 RepID=A0A554VA72_9FLAO|nr:hypothetical protein [Aquimarina algiphila]TSE02790.1 hypothetical protein FOF46_30475 [Aquimarina algiphila]
MSDLNRKINLEKAYQKGLINESDKLNSEKTLMSLFEEEIRKKQEQIKELDLKKQSLRNNIISKIE